ncbi:hypothetical protein SAMN04487820_101141 [Actinopolyspora mzabensis]|uniref:Uncharacterized protein n=1 Tax=Actinopolyspora mzabensis TaxID=995066 RepID=A0A1G8VK33_ACTMZ|nr:hypothetical protein SAMN04487820_101141 [Actinopolyspora mzabensis]
MHELLEAKRQQIEELCSTLSIRRLDLFDSAVDDSFDDALVWQVLNEKLPVLDKAPRHLLDQ